MKIAASLLITLTLIACSSFAETKVNEEYKGLCNDYNNGMAIAIIGDSPEEDSEWYADWSAYLNAFMTDNHQHIKVYHSHTLHQLNVTRYAVLFGKKSKPTYLLESIVEPQTYEYVNLIYSGAEIPKYVQAFQPEQVNNVFDHLCD